MHHSARVQKVQPPRDVEGDPPVDARVWQGAARGARLPRPGEAADAVVADGGVEVAVGHEFLLFKKGVGMQRRDEGERERRAAREGAARTASETGVSGAPESKRGRFAAAMFESGRPLSTVTHPFARAPSPCRPLY